MVSANPSQSTQNWPGRPPGTTETKVSSKVAYPQDGTEAKEGFSETQTMIMKNAKKCIYTSKYIFT